MVRAIIALNVAVYALMAVTTGALSFNARTLFAWGGDLGELSLHGEPWRLLTATVLHASPIHILGNMLLLNIAGPFVETRVGSLRFAALYFASGLAASLVSAWAHPEVVGVGASGAIAGVVGVVVAFYLSGRVPAISGAWVAQTLGINALYSLAPNVDWAAHLGGFLAGLICGFVLLPLAATRDAP